MKEYDFYHEIASYIIFIHSNYLFNLQMNSYFIKN